MDHREDASHGQQELSFYYHHYRHPCYLPLFLFDSLSGNFITAAPRPAKRPTGAENAMIIKHVLKRLRAAWPEAHIVLRGDGHLANPELMRFALADPHTDFIFGLGHNPVSARYAQPYLEAIRRAHAIRSQNAQRLGQMEPAHTRTYHELEYAAGSWPQPFRVVRKAEVMSGDDNPRFVVTALRLPTPECLYRDLYCARGQDVNFIKKGEERFGQRSHLRSHLPGQSPAPVVLLRRRCLAPAAAYRGLGPYVTGSGPARHRHHQTVQNCGAGGAVQRPHPPPATEQPSGHRSRTAGNRDLIPRPAPWLPLSLTSAFIAAFAFLWLNRQDGCGVSISYRRITGPKRRLIVGDQRPAAPRAADWLASRRAALLGYRGIP